MRIILLLIACLCSTASAWAQEDPPAPPPYTYSTGPVSLTIAMAGVVVTSAGFGLMLRTVGPCYCEPRTEWVAAGVTVVAAGVVMVWLGLRERQVTIRPTASLHSVGAVATVRWGQ